MHHQQKSLRKYLRIPYAYTMASYIPRKKSFYAHVRTS